MAGKSLQEQIEEAMIGAFVEMATQSPKTAVIAMQLLSTRKQNCPEDAASTGAVNKLEKGLLEAINTIDVRVTKIE